MFLLQVSLNHISPWLGGGEAPEQGATSPPSVPECKVYFPGYRVYIGVHRVYIGHISGIHRRDWCMLGKWSCKLFLSARNTLVHISVHWGRGYGYGNGEYNE